MKKLIAFGIVVLGLWGIAKFWPSESEPEGNVEVRVNARRPKKARARRAGSHKNGRTHQVTEQQPRRMPMQEEAVEV